MTKLLWVSADGDSNWEERKERVTAALEAGADAVVVNEGEEDKVKELGNIGVVGKDIKAKFITITNKEEELAAAKEAGSGIVVVSTTDWTIIPWENMIAAKQKKNGTLIAKVFSIKDAKTAFETLEVGVDGVLFDGSAGDVKKVKELIDKMSSADVELVTAKITKIKPVGMGDRVCVDTASLFEKGEGMLVGSASSGLFLVHSETIESPYVAARPFRVNAGPVHAYTLLPNGKTTYLSELEAGDEVLAVNHKGETRTLIIGRMKIEKRPLMLVEADANGKTIKSLLQNAETIRLTSKDGKALSVAQLKEGDEVLAYVEEGGRHFGMAVKESINEK
jgi:3-dehydroquinate synthase II